MKKMINISFIYALAAMAGGVFYREFTKFQSYTGVTALGKVHTHLFMLGTFVFLAAALFYDKCSLENSKKFRIFLFLYNIGVSLTAIMLAVRGITQVLGTSLSAGANASISGVAGIGHILTGVGFIMFFLALKEGAESGK
ncbi:DUF2871 domain-containing protein [Murimonas intestini]|uniref:Uncharacterized protein DUF2871 n=1 Tax=Murimonas intestini TaxID=1337051 RepID=A0AB73T3G7_9FIRM|nr:DUF2871 domain-containing protein [Murimonas intestini]MCR1841571.1 DUF2871 domain-containing protein [Murimonas intestini]MCR1867077.1 DUF2871 domain-containing protein [Murimonas intestini]MCR1884100.1 DUF2871 domain-containing protein [Murimonas intestini]